jgi:signal peptidase I
MNEQRLVNLNLRARAKLLSILDERPQKADKPKPRSVIPPVQKKFSILMFLCIAVFIAFIIRAFMFQLFLVPSNSMEPSLFAGDRLLVNKLVLGIGNPFWGASSTKTVLWVAKNPFYKKHFPLSYRRFIVPFATSLNRGDRVVFKKAVSGSMGQEIFIKRVIALPGETVEIQHGVVFVDYHRLKEKYPVRRDRSNLPPVKVARNSYFVLGDNRGGSSDSRTYGAISRDDIIGVVALKVWPIKAK